MTTTLQIEQRLNSLGGARFQRLCDAYLRQRGIESYISVGLTVGREKTRTGTPDSLAGDAEGHTFVEVTTQAKELGAKLADDLAKCLDPDQTGVPIARVRRIYLFFTGYLDAAEVEALYALTRPHGVELTLYGPQALADDLRYRFASLAQEYLDLAIDTGQVLDPETFVQRHSDTAVQTDLDARFVGRTRELAALATHLGDAVRRPTVLLTGPGGVGKTRLALEAARRASVAGSPTTVLCVRSRGADAGPDLRAALERPGRYLILFDDANRLANLAGLLDIALEPRENREVRLLLTVRDYVAEGVRRLLRERGETDEVSVGLLGDDALRQLLIGQFAIRNDRYQRRILELAAGNARLAVMAARVAVTTGDLAQLHDATGVYRSFFDPLQRQCPIITTPDGLRALGAVALIGQLDLAPTELAEAVARLHQLDAATFMATLEALNDLELVDLYETEVVRVSDQTLAAYVLFLALFERRVLSLTDALLELYPRARDALVDSLGGVVRAFRGEDVVSQLDAAVNTVWDRAAHGWPTELFDAFVLTFADARPVEALTRAVAQLKAAPPEPPPPPGPVPAVISFQASVGDPPTLLLGRYRHDTTLRRLALTELVAEARRRPSRIAVLLRLAWERYGFSPDTDWNKLGAERALLDVLWQEAAQDRQIAAPMFIAVAGRAQRTEHDAVSAGRGHSVVFTRFHLPTTAGVRALRDDLWGRLVTLLGVPELHPLVRQAIATYARGGLTVHERAIVVRDLATLEPELLPALDPCAYEDLALIRLLRHLRARFNLGVPPTYAPFLSTPRARLAELLLRDPTEARRVGWEVAAAKRTARLRYFGERANATRLAELGTELAALLAIHTDHDAYQIREGATTVLVAAAVTKPDVVAGLTRGWIAAGNPLGLAPAPLLNALTQATNAEKTWELVTTAAASPARDPWVATWLQLLPADAWTPEHARLAADLLRGAALGTLWGTRDLLDRISAIDPEASATLLRELVGRMQAEPGVAGALSFDFYDGAALATPVGAVLRAHPDLFGDLYLGLEASDRNLDPHAVVLDTLLSLDPAFAPRWLDRTLDQMRRPSLDDHREYGILWRRDDWAAVLGRLARQILGDERGTVFGESFLGVLLRLAEGTADAATVVDRQDSLLRDLVRETVHDADQRGRLFHAIAQLPAERRRRLVGAYLALDPPVEEFAKLALEPTSWGWSGSEVPLLEGRRGFFASLIPLCDRATLLPHRAKIEEQLRELDRQVADARRNDFRDQRQSG